MAEEGTGKMTGLNMDADSALTIDEEADAAYLSLSGVAEFDHTVLFNADINVDVDAAGRAIGVELLSLNAPVPVEALCERFNLDAEDLAPLESLTTP